MPDTLTQALRLFDQYVGLPPDDRARALQALRVDQPELHDALLALLAADSSEHLLDRSPLELFPNRSGARPVAPHGPDPRIGACIGAWKIEQALAHGGMGTIYRASRADGQYQQRVAIKCIRSELSSPTLVASFLNERNILAQLDHPHIAALLDGGVEANGQPWFAMRHVDGEQMDHWCDKRRTSVRGRVELLVQLCDAIGYAHAKSVVHQDIKPSNLLVTEDGQLQVLDFGLSSIHTDSAQPPRIAISYGYAAPEAIAGASPSAAGDVYAIGIVMYQLLAGGWPYPLRHAYSGRAPAPATRALPLDQLAAEAPLAVALQRNLQRTQDLSNVLRGDLASIAMKCVATDPAERYADVRQLHADLQRYLEGRPILIRGHAWPYRLSKFIRRHRMPLAIAGAATAVLVAGGLFFAWQMHRTQQEVAATRAVSHLFESSLGTAALSGLGESRLSSADLIARTEAGLRRLDLSRHPRILAQALTVLAGNYATIGNYAQGTKLASEAAALLDGDETQYAGQQYISASLFNAQAMYRQADAAAARGLRFLDRMPDGQDRLLRVRLLNESAQARWGLADRNGALAVIGNAISLARGAEDNEAIASLVSTRGGWLSSLYRLDEAERDLNEALSFPANRKCVSGNDASLALVQTLLVKQRTQAADEAAMSLLKSCRLALGDNHPATGRAYVTYALSQFYLGHYEAARHLAERGKQIIVRSLGPRHPAYAEALKAESQVLATLGDYKRSIADGREAVRILDGTLGPAHERTLAAKDALARKLVTLGSIAPEMGGDKRLSDEAIALFRQVVDRGVATGIPQPQAKLYLARSLMFRNGHDDLARAAQLLAECSTEAQRYFREYDTYRFVLRLSQAQLSAMNGNYLEADRMLADMIAVADRAPQKSSANAMIHEALIFRAFCSVQLRQKAQARARIEQAIAHDAEAFGADHLITLDAKHYLDQLDRTGTITLAD
jgi:serine/threonine-protein kinase